MGVYVVSTTSMPTVGDYTQPLLRPWDFFLTYSIVQWGHFQLDPVMPSSQMGLHHSGKACALIAKLAHH
jgi:hypothetical protein